MTLNDLYFELQKNGISNDSFYLHGLYGDSNDDDKLSMIIKQGQYRPIWEIYYKERGEKHSVMTFYSEAEACDYFLKRMIKK